MASVSNLTFQTSPDTYHSPSNIFENNRIDQKINSVPNFWQIGGKKSRSSTNFVRDRLSKEVLHSRHTYTRSYQLDEKQPIGQSHEEVLLRTATAIFPSLPFWSRFNGCACARTNREQAIARAPPSHAQGSRVRACTATRGWARRARASSDTRCVEGGASPTSQDVVTVGHQ